MAQAVRKSVDVEQLKEALQRQGIALSADKVAGLAAAIETRLAAGWSGQLKTYDITWTKEKLIIVPADKLGSSFQGDFRFNALLPQSGRQPVDGEAPPDGLCQFAVVGGEFVVFLRNGELVALWPPIADIGLAAGTGIWAGGKA